MDANRKVRKTGGEQANSEWEMEVALVTSAGAPAPNPKEVTSSREPTPRGDEIKETDTHTSGQVGGGSVVRNNHCYGHQNRTHYGTIEFQIWSQLAHVSKRRLTSPNHKVRCDSCPFCDILIQVPIRLEKINRTIVVGNTQKPPCCSMW